VDSPWRRGLTPVGEGSCSGEQIRAGDPAVSGGSACISSAGRHQRPMTEDEVGKGGAMAWDGGGDGVDG
jgi:hypothetical protein